MVGGVTCCQRRAGRFISDRLSSFTIASMTRASMGSMSVGNNRGDVAVASDQVFVKIPSRRLERGRSLAAHL